MYIHHLLIYIYNIIINIFVYSVIVYVYSSVNIHTFYVYPPQICILVDATWAEVHVAPGPTMIKELWKKTVDGLGTNYVLLEIDAKPGDGPRSNRRRFKYQRNWSLDCPLLNTIINYISHQSNLLHVIPCSTPKLGFL